MEWFLKLSAGFVMLVLAALILPVAIAMWRAYWQDWFPRRDAKSAKHVPLKHKADNDNPF